MLASLGVGVLALAHALVPGESLRLGTLEFQRCELSQPRSAATTAAWCAAFTQPENHADPASRPLTLKLALIKSDAAQVKADPLVLLAGGPGQAATDSWPQVAQALALARRERHVILLDQRGTGGSHALRCSDTDTPLPPGETRGFDAERAIAETRACLAHVAANADPAFYTTSDAVADLEALRHALGDVKFNLLGISYGTRVAQQFALRHPDGVRSLILDGVVPNELILGADFARALDDTLQARFALCSQDSACQERFGDVYKKLYAVRARLQAKPLPVATRDPLRFTPLQRELDAESFSGLVRMYAYSPETVALLPLVISETEAGNAAPLLGQANLVNSDLSAGLTAGMSLSVICAEDIDLLQANPADAGLILGTEFVEQMRAQCSVWPKGQRPADFHTPLSSDVATLLLSGEFDPVTPPRYGDQVAKRLSRARHLVAPGQGHNVIGRGCMPRLLEKFIDTLQTATLDAGCLAELGPSPFFLDYSGAGP